MISTCPKCDKPVSIPSGLDSSAAVRCPLCNAEYALSEAMTPTPPELIPVVTASVPSLPLSGDAAETAAETAAEAPLPHEESGRQPEDENEAVVVAEAFSATPTPTRRRRKPKSALQTLIEIVAGGLAGCLVAYYGLAFYYGPDLVARGLPKLPLPGIERLTAARPAADDAKAKPPEKKPPKEKSKSLP